jgi:hypothetical protein
MAAQRSGIDQGQASRIIGRQHFTASSSTGGRIVNGDTVEYAAGHQPLVPDFTATSLTGTPIKMTSYRGRPGRLSGPCRGEPPARRMDAAAA